MKDPQKTILVVDDSSTIRNLIRKELTQGGYNVIEAKTGLEALARATNENQPDLITLDIDMPKLDGFETCKKLQNEYHKEGVSFTGRKRTPVVFVSANDTIEDRKKGFDVGAFDFIAKPFPKGAILETVNNILSPEHHLRGMTALIVDDSNSARTIIAENMAREGLTIIEAKNGLEAMNVLEDPSNAVDIIITDLVMPEMDGITLCNKIRNQLGLSEIPVIFLTSMSDSKELLKVFKAGATDYLIKPFFQEELLARINVHLEKAKLIKRLRKTIDDLEQAEKDRTEKLKLEGVVEMAGTICHELNQPMMAISGYAELMEIKSSKDTPFLKQIEKIKHQIDRMGKITGKLMRVTTYETKNYCGETKIIDINKAIKRPNEV